MTSERPFGKTGFSVRLFGLGGQAALETPGQEAQAEQIINRALELGVNYLDTSAYYGNGISECNIGHAIGTRRDRVFLATKTLSRTHDGAMRDLEQSLTNLQTDHVDLWQIHNVRTQFDLTEIFDPNGAITAFERAKAEGMAHHIGVTGHYDPQVLTVAMNSHDFDAVLMAVNAADIHYRSFITNALPTAVAKEMGVVAMKIPARGRMFRQGGVTRMEQAMGYTLTHPVSTAIIGCSSTREVEMNVRVANSFVSLGNSEMRNIEELTSSYYREGAFFKFEW
jgi:aryl-alcohol dehydrogenase-like predicted oxidoreductase